MNNGSIIEMKKPVEMLAALNGKVWALTLPFEDEAIMIKQYPCSNIARSEGNSTIRLISDTQPHIVELPARHNKEDMYLYFFGIGKE